MDNYGFFSLAIHFKSWFYLQLRNIYVKLWFFFLSIWILGCTYYFDIYIKNYGFFFFFCPFQVLVVPTISIHIWIILLWLFFLLSISSLSWTYNFDTYMDNYGFFFLLSISSLDCAYNFDPYIDNFFFLNFFLCISSLGCT